MEGRVFHNVRVDLEFIFRFESRSNIWEKVISQALSGNGNALGIENGVIWRR
jgi:hypothetical protein